MLLSELDEVTARQFFSLNRKNFLASRAKKRVQASFL
jgi:hypothetical protein